MQLTLGLFSVLCTGSIAGSTPNEESAAKTFRVLSTDYVGQGQQSSSEASFNTSANSDASEGDLEDFSLCIRFLEPHQNDNTILELKDDERFLVFETKHGSTQTCTHQVNYGENKHMKYESAWNPFIWHHFCLSYVKSTGTMSIVLDGENVKTESNISFADHPIPKNIIGVKTVLRMKGHVTDLQMWDNALTATEIITWTSPSGCLDDARATGNMLSWENLVWHMEDVREEDLPQADICSNGTLGRTYIPYSLNFQDAIDLCKKFNASLGIIDDTQTISRIFHEYGGSKSKIFAGFTDSDNEGTFTNIHNKSIRKLTLWKDEIYRIDTEKNCLVLEVKDEEEECLFLTESCDTPMSFYCDFISYPVFSSRGGPVNGVPDVEFIFNPATNTFHGNSQMKIYELEEDKWVMVNDIGTVIAMATIDKNSYPIGNVSWQSSSSFQGWPGQSVSINLNTCNVDDFACNSGLCVPQFSRCNQIGECEGGLLSSDELECEILTIGSGYKAIDAPAKSSDKPVKVTVDIDLQSITRIDFNANLFEIKFGMILYWIDFRLNFKNLKPLYVDNVIEPEDWPKIWIPTIEFKNTNNGILTVQEPRYPHSFVMINRTGSPIADTNSSVLKDFTFNGEDGTLLKVSNYNVPFICDFELAYYPFDTQTCKMRMEIYHPNRAMIKLINGTIKKTMTDSFGDYTLYSYNYTAIQRIEGHQTLDVSLVWKRNLEPLILETFLPTITLNCINQLSNYFLGPDMFEAVITINATVLMTLASLFVASMGAVPSTGSIKYMDVFNIAMFIYPALIIIPHTILHVMHKRNLKGGGYRRCKKLIVGFVQVGLPVILFSFCAAFFIIGYRFDHDI